MKNTITGKKRYASAICFHVYTDARAYVVNKPIIEQKLVNDDKPLRILGSILSPIYVNIGASLKPIPIPRQLADRYKAWVVVAMYSDNQPRNSGIETNVKQVFLPNLSWMYEDNKLPKGWKINNKLPAKKSNVSGLHVLK